MKIAHICLSCFFIDGRSYQENELVRQHVSDGHAVLVIASTETHSDSGTLTYSVPDDYVGVDGARVVRLEYLRGLPAKLVRKLRVNPGVYRLLEEFRPDTMLFHGACGWEILTVARYASNHPDVLFYVDSHEDWNNSARTFLSRVLLHKLYYRFILQRALPKVEKILCVTTESIDFVEDVYGAPRCKTEFFPLGGHPIHDEEYRERRYRVRMVHGIASDEIIFVQSGKQTRRKKLLEALAAFRATPDPKFRLLIVGVLQEDIREQALTRMAEDRRVTYLGWQSSEQLTDLLCAADIYLQPGTQSVTMQHSLCCHCAIILDDVPAHGVYHQSNGWLISDKQPLLSIMSQVRDENLEAMQERSYRLALKLLDYESLSKRILK